MPDREKVIKGLTCCQYSSKSHCDGCPYCYEGLCETNDCTADLASDALDLLKEQEETIYKLQKELNYWQNKGRTVKLGGMPDMDKVMMALECLADGQTCACCDYKPYDDCSRRVARDAIALLKELADEAITYDASVPEQFWPSMRYDPSEDVVACTSCLICGKDIPLRRYESGPRVCSECKEAIALLKEQETELCDRCGRRRLKSNRVEGR